MLSERRVVYCVHFSIDISTILHLKIVRCGPFNWIFTLHFFLFLLKLFSLKPDIYRVLMEYNEFLVA